jgi:succinate dehydrogenase / fumarate reductase iron-sulfur subunit
MQVLDNYITAVVFRFDPDKDARPYYMEYRVETDQEISVLVLLNRIQNEVDRTLSFRSYCCGLQMCQSCLVKVNQKKRLACLTLVKPGERIVIDPANYPHLHIKDLVVKFKEGESL